MTQYTYPELVQLANNNGFSGLSANIIAAIAMAESGGNTQPPDNINTDGSRDRGILQINSYWHQEVPDSCAYDANCSFSQAYRISQQGKDFSQWATYQSNAYTKYLSGTALSTPIKTTNPSVFGSGFSLPNLNPLQPLQDMVAGITGSPFWSWLTSPVRIIKMLTGLLLVAGAIVLLVAPDTVNSIGKVVKNGA